jgi:hypothetical protein
VSARFPSNDTDRCLSLFADVYATGALVIPEGATVLEIGCAEADWLTPLRILRPDVATVGIDWRCCHRPGIVIHGNVLTQTFPEAYFDVVVGVSSIEHIGLGHYSHDPLDEQGDVRCMALVTRWLKPGGWAYLDVPYGPRYEVHGTEYRRYDEATLVSRLSGGLTIAHRWFVTQDPLDLTAGVPPNPYVVREVALHLTKGVPQ